MKKKKDEITIRSSAAEYLTYLYATAIDYDRTAKTTKQFFAKVQNKMHYFSEQEMCLLEQIVYV